HRRAVRRHDHAGRARPLRAAADRAEVPGIGYTVEDGEQRAFPAGELVGVRVAEGLDEGQDALMVARLRALGQVAVELLLRAGLGEPGLRGEGPPAVDQVGAHPRRTSE